jgi:glutaredoxin 2
MPLYRELTIEELKHFEQEFKEFLAVNGIDSKLWIEIKKTDNNKVNELIAAFSDVIYNSVLMKMEYVEFATENDIKYFHYEKDQAELIGLESNSVSFLDNDTVLKAIEEKKASIKAYRTIKKYTQTRETELFAMIKNGCQPSDGKMFKVLEELV